MIQIAKFNIRKIEKKWQKKWFSSKIFEANIEEKPKFFATFPYPYVNGAPHMGHSYSIYRLDSFVRFKRILGYNVLFPQAFHATGEPILGLVERLRKNDPIMIKTMKDYGASDKEIEKMKKDPKYVIKFWTKRWIKDLKLAGLAIDWRRTFITTDLNKAYSKFVKWQYKKLKKLGYVFKGSYPVVWCPHCKSPTSDHDRLEGIGEEPIEYTLIKFKLKNSDLILPCGTLRPETIFGVTNLWINPNEEYWIAKVGNEKWVLSERAIIKLKDQLKQIEKIEKIDPEFLIGKFVINPTNFKEVPILPSSFVDPNNATGIVMSVPAHAPFDWIALKEAKENGILDKLGIEEIKPISIIKIEGFGEFPAIEICEKFGINSLKQKEELEKATKEIYKKEFHLGILKENCGKFAGKKVSEIKEELIEEIKQKGIADSMYELTGKVVCRCGTECHVKILENQWFLKYSDEKWKEIARKALEKMKIIPEEARSNFENTIDWLKDKPCTRKTGLGTKFPWDKEWIIEPLSDSTIYMAYYIIAKFINQKKIKAKNLNDKFFDYVFLGKGNLEEVARKSKLDKEIIEEIKKEFDYFYPVDLRSSGKDLIQNHLTFFIFHHVAIWEDMPEKWPKAIAVNGFVNVEGEKMSKSKGNIRSLRELIETYGSDIVRLNLISGAEGLDDTNWKEVNVESLKERIEFFWKTIKQILKAKREEKKNIDLFLEEKIKRASILAKEFYEELKFRSATQLLIYDFFNDLKWYLERNGKISKANKEVLKEVFEIWSRLVYPLIPHLAEEFWHLLTQKEFIEKAGYPEFESFDKIPIKKEEFLKQTIEDIREILKLVKQKPKKIKIFVAEDWKFKIYKKALESKKISVQEAFEIANQKNEEIVKFVQFLNKKIFELPSDILERNYQFEILEEGKQFLKKQFNCKIEILDASKSKEEKARKAMPNKPGILIE